MKKRQLGPCVTFFPQPATLVASKDQQGEVNLMMASWAGIVSKTPPTMAVSFHRDRKSYANILAVEAFSVNIVPVSLAVEADACGLVSGHKGDKLLLTGLQVSTGTWQDVPLVEASPLNVECRYLRDLEVGDYRLVLGEIIEIHACDSAFDVNGRADIKAFDPLVYLGGMREYWSLGSKEADAYRAGLALVQHDPSS